MWEPALSFPMSWNSMSCTTVPESQSSLESPECGRSAAEATSQTLKKSSAWIQNDYMLASYFEVKKTAEDHLLYHSLSHSGKKAVLEYEKSERFSELKNNKIIEAFNKLLDEIYNMEV